MKEKRIKTNTLFLSEELVSKTLSLDELSHRRAPRSGQLKPCFLLNGNPARTAIWKESGQGLEDPQGEMGGAM